MVLLGQPIRVWIVHLYQLVDIITIVLEIIVEGVDLREDP
jgi:hypothetical protein